MRALSSLSEKFQSLCKKANALCPLIRLSRRWSACACLTPASAAVGTAGTITISTEGGGMMFPASHVLQGDFLTRTAAEFFPVITGDCRGRGNCCSMSSCSSPPRWKRVSRLSAGCRRADRTGAQPTGIMPSIPSTPCCASTASIPRKGSCSCAWPRLCWRTGTAPPPMR